MKSIKLRVGDIILNQDWLSEHPDDYYFVKINPDDITSVYHLSTSSEFPHQSRESWADASKNTLIVNYFDIPKEQRDSIMAGLSSVSVDDIKFTIEVCKQFKKNNYEKT